MAKPDEIGFAVPYSDGSGVEFAVRYRVGEFTTNGAGPGCVELECVDKVQFPRSRLNWLIESLTYIRDESNPEGE